MKPPRQMETSLFLRLVATSAKASTCQNSTPCSCRFRYRGKGHLHNMWAACTGYPQVKPKFAFTIMLIPMSPFSPACSKRERRAMKPWDMRCNDSLKLLDVKVASDAVSLTLEQTFSRITGKIYKGVFFRYGVLQCSLPICSIASAPSTPSSHRASASS